MHNLIIKHLINIRWVLIFFIAMIYLNDLEGPFV
jgi:hypothetical protein